MSARVPGCRAVEDLLAPFALHAVDPDERAMVERHLAGCPRCAHEVVGFREAAASLAMVGGPAPAGVWESIQSGCEEAVPDCVWEGIVASFGQPAAAERPKPAWRRPFLLAAAVFVALVALVPSVRPGGGGNGQTDLSRVALAALADPASDDLWLRSPDGRLAARVVRDVSGRGVAMAGHLPSLPAHRDYQLWALPLAGDPVPLGLLGRRPGNASFSHQGSVAGYAISQEAEGGGDAFRGPAVVSGRLARS